MSDFDAVIAKVNKDHGESTVIMGDTIIEASRLPTGIFPLDLSIGGGIPEGRVTELFGPEGSGKSNVALKLVASHQRRHPELKSLYVDVEHGFDPGWAKKLGVDVEKLYVASPDYGEQAIDIIEGVMHAPDCGLVILDSLAALTTARESEKSAESADPGGSGMVGKKLFNKVLMAQRHAERDGRDVTFCYINQIRHKIGVMFGSPETTPGGFTPKFACALRLRFYGKDVKKPEWSTTHAARKEMHIEVKKNRMPIVSRECLFHMALIPHADMQPGDTTDWDALYEYMQLHEYVKKEKNKYILSVGGHVMDFTTIKGLAECIHGNIELDTAMRETIIAKEVEKAYSCVHIAGKPEKK